MILGKTGYKWFKQLFEDMQKQPPEVFNKNGDLKKFAKFTGEQLYQSLFFNEVRISFFIKKEALAQVFSCKFNEIFKNTFFAEHLWATASGQVLTIIAKLTLSPFEEWRNPVISLISLNQIKRFMKHLGRHKIYVVNVANFELIKLANNIFQAIKVFRELVNFVQS